MRRKERPFKIGYGYDSHRFLNEEEKKYLSEKNSFENETDYFFKGKNLIMGGVILEDKYQKTYGPFKSRSDGDVIYHAVVNGILSAIGKKEARDIGSVFPNTDKANSKRSSSDFMEKAIELLKNTPYEVSELKIMLKGKPRVNLLEVEKNIESFFSFQEFSPDIHLQGTSGEDMDAAGKGLGVEVFALCLLQHKKLRIDIS